jgi:hypothetical protein
MFFKYPPINNSNVRIPENRMLLKEAIEKISKDKLLLKQLTRHHEMYVCAPKGNFGENIFVNIFNDMGLGEKINDLLFNWFPESHKPGADLTVPSLECPNISLKAGQITKVGRKKISSDIRDDHRIKYSSHRLGTHPDLNSISQFLSCQHCDITFLLSPYKCEKYYWVIHENLDFSALDWKEKYNKDKKHTGWYASDENQGLTKAIIEKSMSTQLWIEMRLSSNKIIHVEEISIS